MSLDKSDIVDVLQEIAVLLEIKGDNPFKIRAYDNGARALGNTQEDLDQLIAEERLDKIQGIGTALAGKIIELRTRGSLKFFDDLKASVPAGLLDMLEIPGFGPKKIRKVREALNIETIAALRKACEQAKSPNCPASENVLRKRYCRVSRIVRLTVNAIYGGMLIKSLLLFWMACGRCQSWYAPKPLEASVVAWKQSEIWILSSLPISPVPLWIGSLAWIMWLRSLPRVQPNPACDLLLVCRQTSGSSLPANLPLLYIILPVQGS
ncbi:MAG: helix-hairpin-helix domain-containing protein [Verrucomicrobia bacterium]|nr:helix-hairpin-helix domain-containing protein [Verrucomicrobiota bacterium]